MVNRNTFKDMDGTEVHVGDFVGWKDDIEQSGRVRAFGPTTVQIVAWDSVRGEHYECQKSQNRVWFEHEGVMRRG